MLLSLIVFAIPVLDQPIDFRPEIGTAPTLIANLNKQTGLNLKTDKNVANDVIAIVAPQKSPREIMDQIAYAIEAEWKETNNEWTLTRTDKIQKDQAARDKEITTKELKEAISKIPDPIVWDERSIASFAGQIEGYTRQPASSQSIGAYNKMRDAMPGPRMLVRFLKRTPPETFANIPFGSRVVFSTDPTAMQKRMPAQIEGDIRQYVSENEALANAWIESKDALFPKPSKQTISKVLIAVRRSSHDGLTVEMAAYNPAGNSAFRASRTIGNELTDIPDPERIAEGQKIIELQPLSKSLLTLAVAAMSDQSLSPSPELKDWLGHPKENDPLSLINTEAMQALAQAEGKPLVAAIGEAQLYAAISMARDGRLTLDRYLQGLAATKAIREEREGWICYRENNPALGRLRRVDRSTLEHYYARIEKEKRAGLDAFAELVLVHPTPLEDSLFPIHQVISGHPRSTYPYVDELNIVRFYGLLENAQKDALKAGRDLPLASFNAVQAAVLGKFYYNMRHHSFNNETPTDADGNPIPEPRAGDIRGEPTEAYPNGLTAPFTVRADIKDSPSVFRIMQSGEARANNANSLAWEMFQLQRPDIFPWASQIGQETNLGYVEGQVRQWAINFKVSPWLSFTTRLNDDIVPNGPRVKFSDLPKTFRDQIADALARMAADFRNVNYTTGGIRRLPPPF